METILKNKNIEALIIDDDNDTCFLLSHLLRDKSINSLYVNSLADAKKIFSHFVPSIIFLDNQLPDGKGLNFINYAKEAFPETKIIMISAHTSDSAKRQAFEYGAEFFVDKPFKSDDMLIVISEVLKQ